METKPVTRVDMEKVGQTGVIVRSWCGEWNRADAGAPDCEDYVENGSIPALLAGYEKQGFVVWMASAFQGRALRGKTTRVDVVCDGSNWTIRKYCYGWSAKTPPVSKKVVSETEAQAAIAWLRENRWTLLEYRDRCVAFLGKAQPIHDKSTILTMRRKAQEEQVNYTIDFAFYPS